MVATPIVINSRGLEGAARPSRRQRFIRAVGIAVGMLAVGAGAALLVGLFENGPVTSPGPSARAALPGDLFAPPPSPTPRIVVRYLAPRSTATAPLAHTSPPAASPTPGARLRPSPSPTPSRGGDD